MKEKILTIIMLALLVFAVIALAVSAQDGGQNKIVFLPNLYNDFNYLTPTVTPTVTPTPLSTLALDSPIPTPTKDHTPTPTPVPTKTPTVTPVVDNCPDGTTLGHWNGCYATVSFGGSKSSIDGFTVYWHDYTDIPYVYLTKNCGLVNNTGDLQLVTDIFPVAIDQANMSVNIPSDVFSANVPDGYASCFFVNPVPLPQNYDLSPHQIEFMALW